MKIKLKNNLKLVGKVRVTLRRDGNIVYRSGWQKNLICDTGLNAIMRRLGNRGTVANEGVITYGAVGDGAGVIAASDTTMQNEIERKPIGVYTVTDNELLLEVFFTNSEGIGTLTRWALFGEDATAAADSGTMFEHIAFDPVFTKTSAEDLTIEVTLKAEGV